MKRDDHATVLDIITRAKQVQQFVSGCRREALDQDDMRRLAILYALATIGEAVGRLTPEFVATHPAVPWAGMKAARNRLIHGYDSVDLDVVWRIATVDVPELLAQLDAVVPPETT